MGRGVESPLACVDGPAPGEVMLGEYSAYSSVGDCSLPLPDEDELSSWDGSMEGEGLKRRVDEEDDVDDEVDVDGKGGVLSSTADAIHDELGLGRTSGEERPQRGRVGRGVGRGRPGGEEAKGGGRGDKTQGEK